MNSNAMMTNFGLYTDVIGLINDYCSGDRKYWKRKYDQVIYNMNCFFDRNSDYFVSRPQGQDPFFADIRKILYQYQRKVIRSKIRSVIHFAQSLGDGNKTSSITEILYQYKVLGIYRVAFDRAVRRITQTMGLTQAGVYMYNMNINKPMFLEISRPVFRHLQDYNYTEYMSIFNCRFNLWAVKMDWGTRDIQTKKQAINNKIKQEGISRKRKRDMIEQETENVFLKGYALDNIEIHSVHQKSVTVFVGGIFSNKKIGVDKKTGRVYICNPKVKRARLYADEKKLIHKYLK